MKTDKTVLEYIEETVFGRVELPHFVTIERTTQSKYPLYLLARAYAHVLKKRAKDEYKLKYFTYSKQDANTIKAIIEEHSIWGEKSLYVLEGFGAKFVEALNPPKSIFVIAEVEEGELKTPPFHLRYRRDLLKILTLLLSFNSASLSELIKLDWSQAKGYEDFEPVITKAKLMAWNADQIREYLTQGTSGQIWSLTKRGQAREICLHLAHMGHQAAISHFTNLFADLIHYRALRILNFDEDKCAREMEISLYRQRELEEASKMMTQDDLQTNARRLIQFDAFFWRNPTAAAELFLLNNPTRVRK